MANLARFTISSTPSTDGEYEAAHSEVLSLVLEGTPAAVVRTVHFQVYDPAELDSPRSSPSAPQLSLVGTTTASKVLAATPATPVTCAMPSSGLHSWLVRCLVNGGLDAKGNAHPDYLFERLVSIPDSVWGARKVIVTESTQAGPDGWAEPIGQLVEAVAGATGPGAGTAAGQLTYWDGSQPLWTTGAGQVKLSADGDHLHLGSNPGQASSTHGIATSNDFRIGSRLADGTLTSLLWMTSADALILGHTLIPNVDIQSVDTVDVVVGGQNVLRVFDDSLQLSPSGVVALFLRDDADIVEVHRKFLDFENNVVAPIIRHQPDGTDGVTADRLTIEAQKASHATNGTGGDLLATSGAGPTADGDLELQTGGTTRLRLDGALGSVDVPDGGNLSIGGSPTSWDGGTNLVALTEGTAPTGNPNTGMGYLYWATDGPGPGLEMRDASGNVLRILPNASGTAGAASGTYLQVLRAGTLYKIELLNAS